jgi:hypothetical protein
MIFAIESHLKANRGVGSFEEFKASAKDLVTATLAYRLASDEVKPSLRMLFGLIAEYIQRTEPTQEIQAKYAKTLLGVRSAKAVEEWVTKNRKILLSLNSNKDWLGIV